MIRQRPFTASRQGSLLPAIAVAMLAVGCCLALVLDRLCLSAARGELQSAADAAALAAAIRLADDERINLQVEPQLLTNAARDAAAAAAAANRVAGRPVRLNPDSSIALTFGQYVEDPLNGASEFAASENLPMTVRVQLRQTQELGNPVARLFSGPSGDTGGDAVADAEASLSNLVAGVRPFEGAPVPALPFAIWERDPQGQRSDTWSVQVELGSGGDNWTFDRDSQQVLAQGDGLPEIVLHAMPPGGKPEDANLHVIDVGNRLIEEQIVRQIRYGWSVGDLADYGGEFTFADGMHSVESSAEVFDPTIEALQDMIGQKRLVLLYEQYQPGNGDLGRVTPTRFVAVRILAIEPSAAGPQITVQPTVLATRTAATWTGPFTAGELADLANPYVYKISLTH